MPSLTGNYVPAAQNGEISGSVDLFPVMPRKYGITRSTTGKSGPRGE